MSETVEHAQLRYTMALHAMQSGVATYMQIAPDETTPKHLRVGTNAAHIGYSAIARLLIDKGVITEQEYFTTLADVAVEEQRNYEKRLSDHYGKPVTLA